MVRTKPIGYASWGAITWDALANQLRPSDLLLGCVRNKVGCPIKWLLKDCPYRSKYWGSFSMRNYFLF